MSESKFDPTKPVQTRIGRKARILATDIKSDYPIAAIVFDDDGRKNIRTYTTEGHYGRDGQLGSCDLVNIPQVYYANVYKSQTGMLYTGASFKSIAELKEALTPGLAKMAVGRVKLVEGKFDE